MLKRTHQRMVGDRYATCRQNIFPLVRICDAGLTEDEHLQCDFSSSYAYKAYTTLKYNVELYEFKVRSLCSNARTSDWSETVTLPADKTFTKSEDPKARIATPLNTDPPSPTNTTPIDKVLNPFDIPVSSEDIDEAAIKKRISEITDLSLTDNTQRCGYAISRDLNCDLTPLPNADTGIDFANPKGKYVYINGYEILVTRDAGAGTHTGEGLLYYPYLKTRIPVAWSGASIKKATDGDYGCLSPEVIAIGSQNGVVAADYRQQVIDLLTSGPHAYSGNLKEALAELKKVVADLNAGRTIDPAYAKSVIDAAQKGIEEWKATVSKYFTNGTAPLPPEVQQILNSIEAIKTALNAPKDCLAANIPPASPSGSKKAILFSLKFDACTLSAEQKNVLENSIDKIDQEQVKIDNILKKFQCGCPSIFDDWGSLDGECEDIISLIDKMKASISEGKSKSWNDETKSGQLSLGNSCFTNITVTAINKVVSPEDYLIKEDGIWFKGVVFSVTDNTNKKEKIESLRKYLFGETQNVNILNIITLNTEDANSSDIWSQTDDLTINVEANGKALAKGEYAFISNQPMMPNITVTVKSNKYKKIKAKLIVSYITTGLGSANRSYIDYFPSQSQGVEFNLPNANKWNIDFGETFCGGKAVINFFDESNNQIGQFIFHIRGKNPTRATVYDYITQHSYDSEYWFFRRIAIHESGSENDAGSLHQFGAGTTYGANLNGHSLSGLPIIGYPQGFGIMQIDNFDLNGVATLASKDEVWNWQRNIDRGYFVLNLKKGQTILDLNKEKSEIKTIFERNPNNVSLAADVVAGDFTFIHAPTNISGFSSINNPYFVRGRTATGTQKSFIDAHIIKRYNGGQYYNSEKISTFPPIGRWFTIPLNVHHFNYVERIGQTNE